MSLVLDSTHSQSWSHCPFRLQLNPVKVIISNDNLELLEKKNDHFIQPEQLYKCTLGIYMHWLSTSLEKPPVDK